METPALYLPFPDGLMAYDCGACGARCCKTGTLGATAAERLVLLRRRPALDLFVHAVHDERYFAYRKLSPGCWFLRPDGWCSIHTDHDPRDKPLSCRAHPIYFEPTGEGGPIVASISPGCHWVLDEPRRATGAVTWAEARARHADNVAAGLYETSLYPARPGLPRWTRGAAWTFAREATIRDASAEHGSARDDWAWQLALSRLDTDEVAPTVPAAAVRAARDELDALRAQIERILGLEPRAEPAAPTPGLLRATPMLRAAVLGVGPRPLPYAAGRDVDAVARELPRLLTALSVLATAYADASGAEVDYDALLHLLAAWPLRLRALACLGQPVRELLGDEPFDAEDPALARELLDTIEGAPADVTLGRLLEPRLVSRPVALRLRGLEELGRLRPRLRLG